MTQQPKRRKPDSSDARELTEADLRGEPPADSAIATLGETAGGRCGSPDLRQPAPKFRSAPFGYPGAAVDARPGGGSNRCWLVSYVM
jgi:hypothetical protein